MGPLYLLTLILAFMSPGSTYRISMYRNQVEIENSIGNTLLEPIDLCTKLKLKRQEHNSAMYSLDNILSEKPRNWINDMEFFDSNTWITDLKKASSCSNWNMEKVQEVIKAGSSYGWLNCNYRTKTLGKIALGLDLSIFGIVKMLKSLVELVFRFKTIDIKPTFPEVRRSVCLSTGHGKESLKYWAPLSISKYYDLYIVPKRNVLRIRSQKFTQLTQFSITCGCLAGNIHHVNGSVVELKFSEYHSCLISSVSVGWGHGIIAYRYNIGGTSAAPYRAIRGTEIYNPGTPALLLGIGRLGHESLGTLDCVQNQNENLWPGYG